MQQTGVADATPAQGAWAARVVDVARRAPSIGNTQPWQWYAEGARLELWADHTRALPHTDPDGRSLLHSCGAALHHALLAARGTGLDARVALLPDAGSPDLLARLDLVPGPRHEAEALMLGMVERRFTDRRRFSSWPVPASALARLTDAAEEWGVAMHQLTRPDARERIDPLIEEARAAVALDPAKVAEPPGLDSHDTRVEPRDALLVLATTGDGAADRLLAGQALAALWLEATVLGLSVVPLAQAIEHAPCREALQVELDLRHPHPQVLVRLGWQYIGRSVLPRTPRRPLDDVLRPGPAEVGRA